MFGNSNSEIVRELREIRSVLERLDRKLDMQGTAHSAIMNQVSALIALVRDEFQKLQGRFSFINRSRN
ncbi:UNVERIFIED_ORG: hypothetical protein ABID57_000720 [Arthrobacter sp. UYEF1]